VPNPQILSQAQGTDRDYLVTLEDSSGAVITTFPGTDALTCRIWSGLDQATLASPTATWVNPLAGTIALRISAANLAGLLPGMYRIEGHVAHGGELFTFLDGSLQVTASPGTVAALSVYCTYNDVLLYAPQIGRLQDQQADLAQFAGERARACSWTNETILDGYRPQPGRARRHLNEAGTAAGPYLRWVASGPAGAAAPTTAQMRAYLATAGALRLTAKVVEANAHMAIAIVYVNQPGKDNPYHQLGVMHHVKANELLEQAVIEVDTTSPVDGVYDIRVGQDVTWLT
jgi:hypothetical protein